MFLKEKKMEKGPRKYKEVARRLKRALVEKDRICLISVAI